MIEAATASLMSAQVMRSSAEAVSSAQSFAANPQRIQKVASVSAPYLSPHTVLNPGVKPILVVRDSDTGNQITQYPTPAQIKAYQAAQSAQARIAATQPSSGGEVKEVSYEAAKAALQNSVQYQEIKKEAAAQAAPPAPVTPQQAAPQPVAPIPTAAPTQVSTEA